MVIVIVGLVASIALPRIGISRYQSNAAARTVTGTLSYAQRMAISQQNNINVAFDAARRGMRVHEDRDNDLVWTPGERVTFTPAGGGHDLRPRYRRGSPVRRRGHPAHAHSRAGCRC